MKYEVQFKDGLGDWRRWSLVSTWDKAHRSRSRLITHLGGPSWFATSHVRIKEVTR